jgi:threonine dehydratase
VSDIDLLVNPGRDLSALDVDRARVDRALAAVRAAGVRRPGVVEIGSSVLVLESMQITGSFKVRGAVAGISARIDEARSRGVVAASAGNHGAGVAWASRALGVHATVVVPKQSPEVKRARIAESAELLVEGDGYDAAERAAIDLAKSRGAIFLSPYDDVDVAAGNGGTLARDIDDRSEQAFRGRRVLAPLGGGGLVSGLAAGFEMPREIWGVQSSACPAVARSLQRGQAIETMHASEPTVAEGLEGGVSKSGFDRVRRALSGVVVVDEASIVRAMQWARRELGLIVEGSAACALVPLLSGHELATNAVIVVTGRNVDA